MARLICILFCTCVFVGAFTAVLLSADDPIDVGKYEYTSREDLDKYIRMEERIDQNRTGEEHRLFRRFIDRQVNFCDELSIFWDELEDISTVAQKEKKDERAEEDENNQGFLDDYDNQQFLRQSRLHEKYYKFRTYLFQCIVPKRQRESVGYVRYVNRIKNEKRLLMIWGRVEKTEIWQPVSGEYGAFDAGTRSEEIFIVCDLIKRPRERFFAEWKKERK